MKYDFLLIILEVGGLRPPTSLLSQISHLKIKSPISNLQISLLSQIFPLISNLPNLLFWKWGGLCPPLWGGLGPPHFQKSGGAYAPPLFNFLGGQK